MLLVPDSGFLRTLDSSIKRNTAVIKKLKQINEEQREGLMDELRSVNLSKFVSEAVTAICDAKLKTSDIQAAVQVVNGISCPLSYLISWLDQSYRLVLLCNGYVHAIWTTVPFFFFF